MAGEIVGWDYGRNLPPERWHELPGFEGGNFPSPIELMHASATQNNGLGEITPEYLDDETVICAMKGFFFENLHFEIEIDWKNGGKAGGVYIGSDFHPLLKLHFHIPAEHTIDKTPHSKMEVHLVHGPVDEQNKGTVIGLMVEELTEELQHQGITASPLLQFFRDLLPSVTLPETTEKKVRSTVRQSLNEGFPNQRSYFKYQGGLTTPNCGEPVYFYLLDTPIYTTPEILKKFLSYVPGGNNRPLQPDNGRLVEYFPG